MHKLLQGTLALALFWFWEWAFFFFVTEPPTLARDRYLIYSLLVAGAFLIDYLRTSGSLSDLLHLDVIRTHRLSLRQTLMVVGVLLCFLVAAKDHTMSRMFLFTVRAAALRAPLRDEPVPSAFSGDVCF